jgi:hypothetical protein
VFIKRKIVVENNIRIARQLIRLAKELVGRATFTDGIGEDSDNSNALYDKQLKQIIKKLYPNNVAKSIVMSCGYYKRYPLKGTMGNGNIILQYAADPNKKVFVITALVSERHRVMLSDLRDIANLYQFLKKQVDDGYKIVTSCNTYSIPFLAVFAKKNGFYFNAKEPQYEFGDTGDTRDVSRECVVMKEKPDNAPEDNVEQFSKDRKNLDEIMK